MKRLGFLYVILVGFLLCVTAWTGYLSFDRYFLRQVNNQSDASLRLARAGLSGALERFEPIPSLLADRASIRSALLLLENAKTIDTVNRDLKAIASKVGASDIYLMDSNGLTIAASNFDKDNTFIGNNYTFRPYFSEAIKGNTGRYYALGTSSLKRGYYFSAPVMGESEPIGVMAVKFEVDAFEADWRGLSHELIVTDPDNIVFMSSQPEWLFTSLSPLSVQARERLTASRRYPAAQLKELDAQFVQSPNYDGSSLTLSGDLGGTSYLVRSQYMSSADWTLRILTDRTVVTRLAVQATMIAVLVVALLCGSAVAVFAWRRRQLQRIKAQEEAKQLLEQRVAVRTSDLKREVGERIQAEQELRKAQTDLVQAGKLAALGQMSAALSHELNQPLAAIKSYAENASTYLDRDRSDDARENLVRISGLADRMAQISNSLKNFARKPREQIGAVCLAPVLDEVQQIMGARLRETGAVLSISPENVDFNVIGGHVRLQQVLVNLVNNAIDAVEGREHPKVSISVEGLNGAVAIAIRDNGPGIGKNVFENIFDPFFTTKGINQGLGLGLSISFNILRDFGGNLEAHNHPEGGAEFIATLRLANSNGEAVK